MEIAMINMGYTVVPKLSDDDKAHVAVIDNFINDPNKMRNFNPDKLTDLLNHRQAHLLALNRKQRATTRGGRLQQEVSKVAQGQYGRQARNSQAPEDLSLATAEG